MNEYNYFAKQPNSLVHITSLVFLHHVKSLFAFGRIIFHVYEDIFLSIIKTIPCCIVEYHLLAEVVSSLRYAMGEMFLKPGPLQSDTFLENIHLSLWYPVILLLKAVHWKSSWGHQLFYKQMALIP